MSTLATPTRSGSAERLWATNVAVTPIAAAMMMPTARLTRMVIMGSLLWWNGSDLPALFVLTLRASSGVVGDDGVLCA